MDNQTLFAGIVIGVFVAITIGIIGYTFLVLRPADIAYNIETDNIFKGHCKDKEFFIQNGRECISLRVEPDGE